MRRFSTPECDFQARNCWGKQIGGKISNEIDIGQCIFQICSRNIRANVAQKTNDVEKLRSEIFIKQQQQQR